MCVGSGVVVGEKVNGVVYGCCVGGMECVVGDSV